MDTSLTGQPQMPSFDQASVDPMSAVKRLPTAAYSGKHVVEQGLGKGLGWDVVDDIPSDVAAERLQSFVSIQKQTRGLPPLPPADAMGMVNQKLKEVETQMFSAIGQGPDIAPTDMAAESAALDRMFAPPVGFPRTATVQDADPNAQLFAVAYALGNLLRGGSLGQSAQFAVAPIQQAQERINKEQVLAGQAQDLDRQRAAFELKGIDAQRSEQQRKLDMVWESKVKQYGYNLDDLRTQKARLQEQEARASDAQEKQLLQSILNSKADPSIRKAANLMALSKGYITSEQFSALASEIDSPTLDNQQAEAKINSLKAGAELLGVRAEYLPKEYQLKVNRLAETRRSNLEKEKTARGRLGVAAEANRVRLQLGNQADATRNRSLDLRAPLISAQIAEAAARIQSGQDKGIVNLGKAYDSEMSSLQKSVTAFDDDIRQLDKDILLYKANKYDTAEMEKMREGLKKDRAQAAANLNTLAMEKKSLLEGQKKKVVDTAAAFQGTYRYGGTSGTAIDCSAFTQKCYAADGRKIPRTAVEQYRSMTPVSLNQLQPGDLLFFDTGARREASKRVDGGYVTHVGIYMGNGMFRHMSSAFNGPQTRPLKGFKGKLMGARR